MLPWRRTTISENSASQQIDQGLLTFAIHAMKFMGLASSPRDWSQITSLFPMIMLVIIPMVITSLSTL